MRDIYTAGVMIAIMNANNFNILVNVTLIFFPYWSSIVLKKSVNMAGIINTYGLLSITIAMFF